MAGSRRVGEAEDVESLDEERPLLRIESLELREVDDRGIDFHLSEVGIECAGERETRSHPVLEIDAAVGAHLALADQWIVSEPAANICPPHGVRHDLERPSAVDAFESDQIG